MFFAVNKSNFLATIEPSNLFKKTAGSSLLCRQPGEIAASTRDHRNPITWIPSWPTKI